MQAPSSSRARSFYLGLSHERAIRAFPLHPRAILRILSASCPGVEPEPPRREPADLHDRMPAEGVGNAEDQEADRGGNTAA